MYTSYLTYSFYIKLYSLKCATYTNMWLDLQKHAWFTHPIFQLWRSIKCATNYRLVICRSYGTTIPLLSLKISDLHTVPNRFYESLNVENHMCELCTFSQIRSHIMRHVNKYIIFSSVFEITEIVLFQCKWLGC